MRILSRRILLHPKPRFVVKFFHGDCTLVDNHDGVEYILDSDEAVNLEWDDIDWIRFIVKENEEYWSSYENKSTKESSSTESTTV